MKLSGVGGVFATCFGTGCDGGVCWGKRGVRPVSSRSVIQAEWDCRYEEGSNLGDDMMRDPGVILSHHRHLHSAQPGI